MLWGRHKSPRGQRLLPVCEASGVGRSPTPDCSSFGTCGQGSLPTGCGCGVRARAPGCSWHLFPCRGSSCVVRTSRVCGTRWPLWPRTCPLAVVVAGSVPLWCASWPRVGAPRLVWSAHSRCSGRLSRGRGAFPHHGGCRPRRYWMATRGTSSPAPNRAHCACRWPLPRQGRWARSASYLFGAPRWGCPRQVPLASVLGCERCSGSACVDLDTDVSGFPYRPSFDGGLGRYTGAALRGHQHLPFLVGGRHAQVPRVCVRVLFLAGSGGLASRAHWGAPHLLLWPVLVRSLFARPLPGLDYPVCGCCWAFPSLFFCFFFRLLRPCCLWHSLCSGPGCLGPGRLVVLRPPPLFFFFFPFFGAPLSLAIVGSRPGVPWALALCGPPTWPSPFAFFFLLPSLPLPFTFFFFFLFFPLLFPLPPFCVFFSFPCAGVPVVRFSGCFVCPGLWGVLVCVAVSLGAHWLCPCVVCCCLSRCGVPKALLPKGKRPGCLPTGTGKRAGLCVLCARRA